MVLAVKNPPANAGGLRDAGSFAGLGRLRAKGMATDSSTPAWRIPQTEEPVERQPVGSQRAKRDPSDLAHMRQL